MAELTLYVKGDQVTWTIIILLNFQERVVQMLIQNEKSVVA